MEKTNFKKMALMGMVGGLVVAAQSPIGAETVVNSETYLAGSGCGGGHGCGSSGSLPGYYHRSQARSGCGSSNRQYTADADTDTQNQMMASKTMSEKDLMSGLNDQGKSQYQSLSPEGKALALKIASDNPTKDKNDIVRDAARQMAQKRNGMMNQR